MTIGDMRTAEENQLLQIHARERRNMTTNNERAANDFDCDLYRLITRARRLSEEQPKLFWSNVASMLAQARHPVRKMMSEDDLEKTV